jgi:hypothetical protein
MATSASQTYIARLGFQDRDRSSERHGLACEYLFERMLELEVAPDALEKCKQGLVARIKEHQSALAKAANGYYSGYSNEELKELPAWIVKLEISLAELALSNQLEIVCNNHKVGECVNVPITSRSYVNGFADVLISNKCIYNHEFIPEFLGEVKITKEPAENVLQQINFYLSYLPNIKCVYVLTDYDPGDLKRLCAGTKIKVYRLGQVFEQWLAGRTTPETEEL